LRARGAHGRLHAHVEELLAAPDVLAAAARLLLEQHFTPALEDLICAAVGLDVEALDDVAARPAVARRRTRRAGFAEEVLRAYAYAYACAFCGFDGALGRDPVGLEATHVHWHARQVFKQPAAHSA
jgi:putative restriction endonuclease